MNKENEINQNGTTIVIASQLLTELEDLCDRICVLSNGHIVKEGTIDQIRKEYTPHTEIKIESRPGDYAEILKSLKEKNATMAQTTYQGNKLVIYTPEAEKLLHHLLHILEKKKETLIDIDLNKPSLSEVFESLVKK